jgi:hypothetical protein
MWNLKSVLIEAESGMVVARGEDREQGGLEKC